MAAISIKDHPVAAWIAVIVSLLAMIGGLISFFQNVAVAINKLYPNVEITVAPETSSTDPLKSYFVLSNNSPFEIHNPEIEVNVTGIMLRSGLYKIDLPKEGSHNFSLTQIPPSGPVHKITSTGAFQALNNLDTIAAGRSILFSPTQRNPYFDTPVFDLPKDDPITGIDVTFAVGYSYYAWEKHCEYTARFVGIVGDGNRFYWRESALGFPPWLDPVTSLSNRGSK